MPRSEGGAIVEALLSDGTYEYVQDFTDSQLVVVATILVAYSKWPAQLDPRQLPPMVGRVFATPG